MGRELDVELHDMICEAIRSGDVQSLGLSDRGLVQHVVFHDKEPVAEGQQCTNQ